MLGRIWKSEYQAKEYSLVDEKTERVFGVVRMPVRDPYPVLMWSGFGSSIVLLFVSWAIGISSSMTMYAFYAAFVVGICVAWFMMSESNKTGSD